MKICNLLIAALAAMCFSSTANAAYIRTDFGKGADAEVRESQFTAPDFGGSFSGVNRGNNGELATRLQTANQSSISYVKFDIGSLPPTADAFWTTNSQVSLSLFARNGNNFALFPNGVNAAMEPADLRFSIYTLDPNGTYNANRTDRVGLNNYTATYNQYDWVEGTGDQTGISFYDAPGIQPFCMNANNCGGPTFDSTRGVYDDFDSNAIYIGDYIPEQQYPGVGALPAGSRLFYTSDALRDAVMAAVDAGKDTVTFMIHHKGPVADTVQQALGRNYVMTPKDFTGSIGAFNNATGRFNPALQISVPEPASLAIACIGCLGLIVARRRQ